MGGKERISNNNEILRTRSKRKAAKGGSKEDEGKLKPRRRGIIQPAVWEGKKNKRRRRARGVSMNKESRGEKGKYT